MANPYDIFVDRGFLYQCTEEEGLRDLFERERVTAYIGFDATAKSFHVGNLIPIMSLKWLQKTGHRPIPLMGGGTTMIGDPSGKTEARQLLPREDIKRNMEGLKGQMARYIDFGSDQAQMVDNGDWLLGLNYIEFLRDIGRHFSVNRMLSFESYKARFDTGLTFIEFNYQILQAYDFLVLYQKQGNKLQMGGQDQWGNIVAGIDLIRRVTGGQAFGMTFALLQDAKTGVKFGKTHAGAIWLDAEMTSPYDFFQFWRNTDDQMVKTCLGLFTMLPMDEVRRLSALEGSLINRAKEILAFEVTALCHGPEEASKALAASFRDFSPADPDGKIETSSDAAGVDRETVVVKPEAVEVPFTEITLEILAEKPHAADLFQLAGLTKSKGEARNLIRGGGAYANDQRIDSEDQVFSEKDFLDGMLTLRAGKKRYHRLKLETSVLK